MTESLDHNQIVELKVKGTSMHPTLLDNQTVVGLKKYDGQLKSKMIYLFKHNDIYVLHRYIKTKEGIHYFRGDALYQCELLKNDDSIIAFVAYMRINEKKKNPYSFFSNVKLIFVLFLKKLKYFIRKLVKRHG